ncbi:MAG: hypothetical protein KDA91_09685 [Planctomycetaceae bacterium]|nr:hypothetical protein [Planctomycetaceae bacterium]
MSAIDGNRTYNCPNGDSIGRAIHLARLSAGWRGCDLCDARSDHEGISGSTTRTNHFVRVQRTTGIIRTENGIRGQYLNQLTRQSIAPIVRVLAESLTTADANGGPVSSSQQPARSSDAEKDFPPEFAASAFVIVGYDNRASSPDIFVGVTAILREVGLDIIDAGRCTPASVCETLRQQRAAAGAIFVTGSGFGPDYTGLDAFDSHGDPLPVVWKDHGITVRVLRHETDEAGHLASAPEPDNSLANLLIPRRMSAAPRQQLILEIPESLNYQLQGRSVRTSGHHNVVDCETHYRQWVRRWFPAKAVLATSTPLQVLSDDPIIVNRAHWLAEETTLPVVVRNYDDKRLTEPKAWRLMIDEDDRHFRVTTPSGRELELSEMAAMINRNSHSRTTHMTAHVDEASGRFWLSDTARPTSGAIIEHIRDPFVTIALLMAR